MFSSILLQDSVGNRSRETSSTATEKAALAAEAAPAEAEAGAPAAAAVALALDAARPAVISAVSAGVLLATPAAITPNRHCECGLSSLCSGQHLRHTHMMDSIRTGQDRTSGHPRRMSSRQGIIDVSCLVLSCPCLSLCRVFLLIVGKLQGVDWRWTEHTWAGTD